MSVLYVVQYAQSRRQQSDDNSDASTSRLTMIPHCSVSQSAVMSDVGSNSCAVTPQRADSPSLCASYASTDQVSLLQHSTVSENAGMSDVENNPVTPRHGDCQQHSTVSQNAGFAGMSDVDNIPVTPRRADSSLDACSVASSYQVSIGSSTPKSMSSITATSATPSASDKMFSVVSAAKCYQFLLRGDIADDLE